MTVETEEKQEERRKELEKMQNLYDEQKCNCMFLIFQIFAAGGDIGNYFKQRGIKTIAIWGNDVFAVMFADIAIKSESLNMVGLFMGRENKMGFQSGPYGGACSSMEKKDHPQEILNEHNDIDCILFFSDFFYLSENKKYTFILDAFGTYEFVPLTIGPMCSSQNIQSIKLLKEDMKKRRIHFLTISFPRNNEVPYLRNKTSIMLYPKEERYEWIKNENGLQSEKDHVEFTKERLLICELNKKTEGYDYIDFKGNYFDFKNNKRIVYNVPANPKRKVVLSGPCMVIDQFHRQDRFMGQIFQDKLLESGYQYETICFVKKPNILRSLWFRNIFEELDIKAGDYFVWMDLSPRIEDPDMVLNDLYEELYKEYGNEFFYDFPFHFGCKANERLSERIIDWFKSVDKYEE